MKKNFIIFLIFTVFCAAVFMCGCTGNGEKTPGEEQGQSGESKVLKVFHAGSLAAPMEEMEKAFENKYSNVDVQLYSGGSTKLAKEITELQKTCDVYASADYLLIPDLMVPDYASWYATFAKNKIVLCFTEDSKYADSVNADNWYEILGGGDVAWAFSDPNLDPCGYRSLMTIQLSESYYNDDMLFDNLVSKNSKITTTDENGVTIVNAKETDPKYPLSIDAKSINLITGLEAGNLDYAWEYRSVAEQNADSGIKYIELPEAVDLSSVNFADSYAKVKIDTTAGVMTATPVVYGVTVPKNSENPDVGIKFVEMLVGKTGQEIMNNAGQPAIVPADGYLDVPAELAAVLAN